jgi:hypothetical protein
MSYSRRNDNDVPALDIQHHGIIRIIIIRDPESEFRVSAEYT